MNAEQLARLGNLRSALELLFAECDVNVASHPTFFVDRIDEWSAWDLPGALYGATRLREQVFEAYRLARVEVPDAVLRLFVAPEPRVGSASFPVVLLDGRAHVGTLRTIAMALSSRSLATIGDPAFTDAVESARRHVLVRCTGAVKQRIRDAQWTILPALESNAALADGSVALAAFVAFLSLALERAVAPAWVFSGVLRDGVFAAPAASTFDEKLRAIGSRTFVRTVFCPRAAGSMASDDRVDE